jgi:glutathione synthase
VSRKFTDRRRRHNVWVAGVAELSLDADDRIVARAHCAGLDGFRMVLDPPGLKDVQYFDALLLRADVERDRDRRWAHDVAIGLARAALRRGLVVLNDPDGLAVASSTLYLSAFPPQLRPQTLISRDPVAIRDFIAAAGRCVLKPLDGTLGRDVFLVDAEHLANVSQIVDVLTRDGFCVAQRFIDGAAEGDTRVLMLEGEPISVDGHIAAFRRVPSGADFRSSVDAGGAPAAAVLTGPQRAIIAAAGAQLKEDGIFLAGLEIVADKLVEINVACPGGFAQAARFSGVDFTAPVIAAIEQRVASR